MFKRSKAFLVQLWNSPTFTSWGSLAVRSLRLLAVTPLILVHFSDVEIAAWYLFGSLGMFGEILQQRIGVTFSRMFAFSMGGAKDLSPIEESAASRGDGKPNWPLIGRVYGTVSFLQAALATLNVLIALALGGFALTNLLRDIDDVSRFWNAFFLMQGTSLLAFIFYRYEVVLRGLNYVALQNRWTVIFGLLSVLAGAIALQAGAGLFALVAVMQGIVLLGILRNKFLVSHVEEGRLRVLTPYRLDRQVFGWAWPPLWKGLISNLANLGVVQLSGVIFTIYGSTLGIASYLFSLRMMRTISQFSSAPFVSQMPRFSRMIASTGSGALQQVMEKRMLVSNALLVAGVAGFGLLAPPLLRAIGSNIEILPLDMWLVLGVIFLHERFNTFNLAVCAIGNNMVLYWRQVVAGGISLLLLWILVPLMGVWGTLIALGVPALLILNWAPLLRAAAQLSCPPRQLLARTYLPVVVVNALIIVAALLWGHRI